MLIRKGQSTAVHYVIVAILLAILFLLAVLFRYRDVTAGGNLPQELEEFIFTQRFISTCFGYQETEFLNKRDLIDWSKFNDGSLNDCFHSEIAGSRTFRLTLVDVEAEDPNVEESRYKKTASTINWPDSVRSAKSYDVSIMREGKVVRGELTVES